MRMINQAYVDKAMELLKEPIETRVEVTQTVEIEQVDGKVEIKPAADYRSLNLKKGNKVCLDFGNHQVGYVNMKLGYKGSHPDAPVLLKLHFAENPVELFEDPEEYHGWVCSSWIEYEQIHVDVVPSELKLPRRYAFRYLQIEVIDISSKFDLCIEDVICTAVSGADDNKLIPFNTENTQDKRLDEIACRTLHDCMQVVFEDGPKRDRRLWIGDLRIQALANYMTYQNNDMVLACIYLLAGLTQEDGRVGACLFLEPEPEVDDTHMYDYSLFFVNILWDYYENTGDKETLKELWPTALRQIELAREALNRDMIVEDSDRLGWCFLDWNLNLNKQAGAQGVLLYATSAAIKISQALDDVMNEESLAAFYCEIRDAANDKLWDKNKKCYVSGKDRQVSIASQVWMVLGEAIEGEDAYKLLRRVKDNSEAEAMVTPYMYHNYVDALIKAGNVGVALEELKEYWGAMADLGADTFWELYNPVNPYESPYGGTIVNSYCHAWSCAPAYFLRKYS